jgi:glutamate synthase (NADPH/NADH) large chain
MFELKALLKDYASKTGSKRANKILENFRTEIRKFWMVAPRGIKPSIVADKRGE